MELSMGTVGIFEAKNRLSELVERAGGGEEIEITRRGRVVARLMPPVRHDAAAQARALAIKIRRNREGHDLGPGIEMTELIQEGRP